MQVFHDEYGLCRIRQVFAVFVVTIDQWLIDLEVTTQVVDLYDAKVFLFDHPAVRLRVLWRLRRQ